MYLKFFCVQNVFFFARYSFVLANFIFYVDVRVDADVCSRKTLSLLIDRGFAALQCARRSRCVLEAGCPGVSEWVDAVFPCCV